MNWIYIITWCIVTTVQDPCPEKPYTDKFGVTHNPALGCLVYHAHKEYDCDHSKVFYNSDSATTFYYDALKEYNLERVKIDSTQIKEPKK